MVYYKSCATTVHVYVFNNNDNNIPKVGCAVPVGYVPVGDVPVGYVPVGYVPVGYVPVGDVPVGNVPVGDVVPVGQTC